MIELKYGNEFDEDDLVAFVKESGRRYIVQGQKAAKLADHSKSNSLDVWLRNAFPSRADTKLADNYVLDALVRTGKFEIGKEICPDSGNR